MTVPSNLEADWRECMSAVEKRLAAGAEEYGDASLRAPPAALVGEVIEELEDVIGWSFLARRRMKGIEHIIRQQMTDSDALRFGPIRDNGSETGK